MFEYYTERARRVIFFARYEASQLGSMTIETEHFLLGLAREDKDLVQRYCSADLAQLRRTVQERVGARDRVSTSIDLPLSNECKRILSNANEEARSWGSPVYIDTEHLLLGILQEPGCLAARILAELGVQLDTVRDALKEAPPRVDVARIHAMVSKLPSEQLDLLRRILERGFQQTYATPEEGRFSSSRHGEDGALVVDTLQVIGGQKVSIREQYRLTADGKKVLCSVDVSGPQPAQQYKYSMEFDAYSSA